MDESETNRIIKNWCRKASQNFPVDQPVMGLQIGDRQTFLIAIESFNPPKSWILPIGKKSTGEKYFSQSIPTEAEVENAIVDVENAIMTLAKEIEKKKYTLVTEDALVKEVATYADQREESLSLHEMENVFSRYAAIVTGRPASMDVLPLTREFASGLLILREIMHHLGFKEIIIIQSIANNK